MLENGVKLQKKIFFFFGWIVSALYLSLWVWDEDIFYSKLLVCGGELVCNYKGMCVLKTMSCKYERGVSVCGGKLGYEN